MVHPNTSREAEKGTVNRRRFLMGVAGAVGLATVGTSGVSAGDQSNTVNLGEKGLSPGDDITPLLEEHWTAGTHVVVPGGTYSWSGGLELSASENSWLEGDGQVVLEGNPSLSGDFMAEDGAHVRWENITIEGVDSSGGQPHIAAHTEDAVVEFVNVNRPGGADKDGSTGFYVDNPNAGVARFTNCTVAGFPDNGIYASSFYEGDEEDGMGRIEVYGGLYKNSDVNQIRIGGTDSKIVGASIVVDGGGPYGDGGDMNGIRIREAGENILLADLDITVLDVPGAGAPIEVRADKFEGPDPSSAILRNVRCYTEHGSEGEDDFLNVHGDYEARGKNINLSGPGGKGLEGSGPFENVQTGDRAETPTTEKRIYDQG